MEFDRDPDFREQARRALATRARPGLPIYFLAWLLLGASVSFRWPRPSSLVLGGVIAALTLGRLLLVLAPDSTRAAGDDRWMALFRTSSLAIGFALGLQTALLLLELGPGGGHNMALAVTAAVGSVAIFVFAPDLPLVLGFPVALNAPLAAALLWRGDRAALVTLAADVVFVGYCLAVGRRLHAEFWDAARSARLLRARAAELEDARERLARSRDELEVRVEERTREASEREKDYRRIFESAHDAILILDAEDQSVLAVNGRACELYGLPPERFVGLLLDTISKDPARGKEELRTTLTRGSHLGFETVQFRADGREMVLEVNASVIEYQGRPAILSVNRDVTARAWAVSALRESENRYRALFEASPFPLWVCDPATLAIRDANEAAVALYGYTREEFRATTLHALQASSEFPKAGTEKEITSAHKKKDGTRIRVEVVSRDLELEGRAARLVLAHDVTARELLEEQLRQARKMEAIGRLAGGIAHDFNNVLTAILGYGELLHARIGADPELKEPLDQILVAGKRAAALTRQLLAFSRKQILAPEVIDLNLLVHNLTAMLVRIIGEDVELVTRLHPAPVRVKADPGQIEQVVVNLVVNARDAMPQGGRLTIETSAAGADVVLAIRDTGVGIDGDTRRHLFEPFFTTKAPGKGTGLGLATVQGIVEQSGGRVDVVSEPGRGSEFRVTLPASAQRARTPSEMRVGAALGGHEVILLVEDETQVRALVHNLLEERGYTVVRASDAEEALRVAGERGEIHLLLTDLVLPGIGGADLAALLQANRPRMKVLFVSGYTGDGVARRRIESDQDSYLAKPFEPGELLRRVRAALDAPARPSADAP